MKKHFLITALLIAAFIPTEAQKKNYFSLESGVYFGKANKNIASSMTQSGFGDTHIGSFSWTTLIAFGSSNTKYPSDNIGKLKYRIRAGHSLNTQTAIEIGFGLSYYGSVSGYDKMSSGNYANRLWIRSRINMLYAVFIKNNSARTVGFGAGPAFSLYKLTSVANNDPEQKKNYLLPGGMVTGFWNFLSKKSWFVGIRTEMSLTVPVKIDEMKVTNSSDPSFVSTFKSTKTGSLNGSVTLNAGIRF